MDDKSSCDMLVQIVVATKKKDLEKLCSKSVITMGALSQFIEACEMQMLPWIHQISPRDFVPEQIRLTTDNMKGLSNSDKTNAEAIKSARILQQFFAQRRYLVGHIFYLPDHSNWHFFYFDQRDLDHKKPHFVNGPHIHLINHLWPQHTAQSIWEHFNTGNPEMNGAYYIRCEREINDPEKIFNP